MLNCFRKKFYFHFLSLLLLFVKAEWCTCISKVTIIGSDNGLSPPRDQAIIWTNAGILLIGPLGINCKEMLIEIHAFPFKKMHLKMLYGKWRPSCLGPNVLMVIQWGLKLLKFSHWQGQTNFIPYSPSKRTTYQSGLKCKMVSHEGWNEHDMPHDLMMTCKCLVPGHQQLWYWLQFAFLRFTQFAYMGG